MNGAKRICVNFNEGKLSRVSSLLASYINDAFPGAHLTVISCGDIVLDVVLGYAEITPYKRSLTYGMLFDLASLTKALVTSVIYGKLVEEGLISLRQKVSEIVPEFVKTVAGVNEVKERIRLWMLLSHTSGLPPWMPFFKLASSREEIFLEALKVFPASMPGEVVTYSDINYIILTYIAELVTGERIDRLFEKYVAKALNLKRTSYNPLTHGFSRDDVVATEVDEKRGGTLVGIVHDENAYAMNGVSGHAGLFSSIEDSSKIIVELIKSYRGESDALLPPIIAQTFLRPWACDNSLCYGIGWRVNSPDRVDLNSLTDLRVPTSFSHTGFTGTSIWFTPELDLAILLYTNRVHPSRANEKIFKVRPLIHNVVLSSIKGLRGV